MLKVGDQVTVVGIHDGGVHCCFVSKIAARYPAVFLASIGVIDRNDNVAAAMRWCGPQEEGTVWAHGWDTVDAVALRSLAALDTSR